jgi:oligopeptide/dipeptide ABC transporter ATP-binding protein
MSETFLVAREVTVRYPRTSEPALVSATLEIARGATIGIVGESGSGKTTFARALVGWVRPTRGMVEVGGRAWSGVRRRDPLHRRVQMIFQDPYASVNPRLTARETVAEVFQVWDKLPRPRAFERAEKLLTEVGLARDTWDRRSNRLSGGQCQRVSIARALACAPDVLIADEPTSSLDGSVQALILNLILDLRAAHGMALVLISHDLAIVRYVTDEALVMYRGRVVERGPTDALFTTPRHPYTRVLLDSIPGREGPTRLVRNAFDPSLGCVFAARCPRARERCEASHPPLVDEDGRAFACYYPFRGEGRCAV